MTKGKVYILTNPSLNGWIKIGMTDKNDIQDRLDELNRSTAIPLCFRVFALLHCDNPKETEQAVHKIFDSINPELHAIEKLDNGKTREREFFQIEPERAYQVLESISSLMQNCQLEKPNMSNQEIEIENIIEQVSEKRTIRPMSTFAMVDIPIGAELIYARDESIKCKVIDSDRAVEYNGKEYSLSSLASELQGFPKHGINGWYEFKYEGERLWDRRNRFEEE